MNELRVGQQVEVTSGSYAGLTGIIVNITPSKRYCEVLTLAGPRMFLARELQEAHDDTQ